MVHAFPFEQLPVVARHELALGNAVARWLAVVPRGPRPERLEQLVAGPVAFERATAAGTLGDPHAAACELRIHGQTIAVRGASGFVRQLAQRLLGGPEELAAPRPLTDVEQAIWALVVAAAVEDLGVAGEVWPAPESGPEAPGQRTAIARPSHVLAFGARLAGVLCTVELGVPAGLELAPPPDAPARWVDRVTVACPIVVGRCPLARGDLGRLARRAVITLERVAAEAELVVLGGAVGLAADANDPLVVRVATEYVPRAMALPDDARIELTVGLGTARLSLRQVMGLAVGEVVPLGRSLAGPFEIRAEGTLIRAGRAGSR